MSQEPLVEKLARANGDITKLCEFFAARKGWNITLDAGESMREFGAAAAALDTHLKKLINKCGCEPIQHVNPEVALLPVGALDNGRLEHFATFLRDLETWFDAQTCPTDCPEGVTALQSMEANVANIIGLTEAITATPDPATASGPYADAVTQAAATGDATNEATPSVPPGVPLQLVLDDTDEKPLVQEVQGITELTEDCQKAVDDFLAAWDLNYSYYNRKKLLVRLLRWISSAPEGYALVMKMKTAEEPFEPYPSYISRNVLAGKPPPENQWS